MTASVGPFHVHVLWTFEQGARLAQRLGKSSLCLSLTSLSIVMEITCE